jgi:hypothetical protein
MLSEIVQTKKDNIACSLPNADIKKIFKKMNDTKVKWGDNLGMGVTVGGG